MVTVNLVKALLNFESDVVRAALLRAYLSQYPDMHDRATWATLLPEVFEQGQWFTPIELRTVLNVIGKCCGQWQAAEQQLGLPFIRAWNPDDENIHGNLELDIIPLTAKFLNGILEDNVDCSGKHPVSVEPGQTCKIYNNDYIILDTVKGGMVIADIKGILIVPLCLIHLDIDH